MYKTIKNVAKWEAELIDCKCALCKKCRKHYLEGSCIYGVPEKAA